MDELLAILEEINDEIDYHSEDALIDDELLTSIDIIALVSEIDDAFGVKVTPADYVPENFNNIEAMWEMIQRLQNR